MQWQFQTSLMAVQWELEKVTLCNWGSFDGIHVIPIAGDHGATVTCVSGRTGSGKSTIFDAMTTLLEPSDRRLPLNKASNRESAEPRRKRDYVRGKLDLHDEGYAYLRHGSIVSAIGATYRSTEGASFHIAKFFHMPSAETSPELRTFYLTSFEPLHPSMLNPHFADGVDRAAFRRAFPAARLHDTQTSFMTDVCDTLGIPNEGGASNALVLLNNILSGESVGRIDALYKRLVLDEPPTFSLAESALAAYREHRRAYESLSHYETLLNLLRGMREEHSTYVLEGDSEKAVTSLLEGSPAPIDLWSAQKAEECVSALARAAEARLAEAESSLADSIQEADEADARLEDARVLVARSGGDRLDALRVQERAKAQLRDTRESARRALANSLRATDEDLPETGEAYARLLESLGGRGRVLASERSDRSARKNELNQWLAASDERSRGLEEDIAYYGSRKTRVRRELSEARDRLAEGAGLDPEDLPFLAEIVDVAKGADDWRLAINLALKPAYNVVLMSSEVAGDVRRLNNERQLGERLSLEEVDVEDLTVPEPMPKGWVSTKLIFDETSMFAPWARRRVTGTNVDYECVDDVNLLNRDGAPRMTITGQTRRGQRGAIGHRDPKRELVIGFTNEALVEDLTAELENERALRSEAVRELRGLERQDRLQEAIEAVLDTYRSTPYETFDVAAAEREIADIRSQIVEISTGHLAELVRRRDGLKAEAERARERLGAVKGEVAAAGAEAKVLAATEEARRLETRRCLERGVSLSAEQQLLANEAYVEVVGTGQEEATGVKQVEDRISGTRRRLSRSRAELGKAKELAETALVQRFTTYQNAAGEDALEGVSCTIDSYPDFEGQLQKLERGVGSGNAQLMLHQMMEATNAALAPLQESYRSEVELIRERVNPINEILSKLDFGERHGRLSVWCKSEKPVTVVDFRRRIDAFAQSAHALGPRDEVKSSLIRSLDELMGEMASALEHPKGSVLDPRVLVTIKMRASWPEETGMPDSIYETLGSGSGGETKELVSFIYGSALLYYLGDQTHHVPSYRTVMLDEAFTESDPEYTVRCIRALNGFGFQLILAVPTEKINSVASASDNGLMVVKNGNVSCVSTEAWKEYVS